MTDQTITQDVETTDFIEEEAVQSETPMQVSCLQDVLSPALKKVSKAVSGSSSLPVLENVLLEADGERLRLTGTNLDFGVTTWVGAKVHQAGRITVPGKLLADMVNLLPASERVDLTSDPEVGEATIQCGKFEATLNGISGADFPAWPAGELEHQVWIDPDLFKQGLSQVLPAVGEDNSRPILTGVRFQIVGNTLSLWAADGFMLATTELTLTDGLDSTEPVTFIVPGPELTNLAKLIGDQEDPILFGIWNMNLVISLGDADVYIRLLEGKYPDLMAVVPGIFAEEAGEAYTQIVILKDDFLKAVKFINLVARDGANIVRLTISPDQSTGGQIDVAAKSYELGENNTVLPVQGVGPEMSIAFNGKFLQSVLTVIKSDYLVVKTSSSTSPGQFLPFDEDDNLAILVMPMHEEKERQKEEARRKEEEARRLAEEAASMKLDDEDDEDDLDDVAEANEAEADEGDEVKEAAPEEDEEGDEE